MFRDNPDNRTTKDKTVVPHLRFQLIGPKDLCSWLTGSNTEVIETLLHINGQNVHLSAATNYDSSILKGVYFKISQLSELDASADLALFIFDMNNKNTFTDIKYALDAYALEYPRTNTILVGIEGYTNKTQLPINKDKDIHLKDTQEIVFINDANKWIQTLTKLVNNIPKPSEEALSITPFQSKLDKKRAKYLKNLKRIWNDHANLSFEERLKLILEDYTKADVFARLVTNTRKRNHISDVNAILNNNAFDSDSLEKIWQQICDIKLDNPMGYLAAIKFFLEEKVDIRSEIRGIKNEAEQNPYRHRAPLASTSTPAKPTRHAVPATNSSLKIASSLFKPSSKHQPQTGSSGLKYKPNSS